MEDISSWTVKNDVDISDLERKLNEVFHELAQKRSSLEDVRQQLNSECSTKHDLQIEVDRLNREGNDIKIQLEAATKAFHTCEDGLNASRATCMRQKQQLDAALKTSDKLREQAAAVQSENITLRNKVEEFERQLRSNLMVKESCMTKQAKTHTLLETLTIQVRCLEKDSRCFERLSAVATELGNKNTILIQHHNSILKQNQEQKENLSQQVIALAVRCLEKDSRCFERLSAVATELGNKNTILIQHHNSILKQNQEQKENLSQQVIALAAENDLLKEQVKQGLQDSSPKANEKANYMADIMQEWQNSLSEMKARAASEAKESERLQQTLKGALEAQTQLQALETTACQRIKELENVLQEERELHIKPLCENIYQQTERVEVAEIGCGSENKIQQHIQVQTEQLEQCNIEIQTDLIQETTIEQKYSSYSAEQGESMVNTKEESTLSPGKMLTQSVAGLPLEKEHFMMNTERTSSVVEDISDYPTQKLERNY